MERVALLEKIPDRKEILDVVRNCDPIKSSGYDGFNLKSIKIFWDKIGEGIISFFISFFILGQCDEQTLHGLL